MYGEKMGGLRSLSTITKIVFFLEAKRGNPKMKSIEIESHFQVEIFSSLNSLTGRWCSALTFWQVKHLSTYSVISLFMLSPTKSIASNLDTFLFLLDVLNIECRRSQLVFSLSVRLCQARTNDFEILACHPHPHFPFSKFCLILRNLASSFWWDFNSSNKEGCNSKADSKACVNPHEINPNARDPPIHAIV